MTYDISIRYVDAASAASTEPKRVVTDNKFCLRMGEAVCAVLHIVVSHGTRHENIVTDDVVLRWLPINQ